MMIPSNRVFSIEIKSEREFLRRKTREIPPEQLRNKKFQRELRKTFQKMRHLMLEADGVGLSANQAGIPLKFFIARTPDKNGKMKFYSVVNPKIVKISKTNETSEEGCLSVAQKFGPVERATSLTLEGYNIQGKKIKIEARGILARIFQHETDHLDGKLFIEKAKYIEGVEIPNEKISN